MSIEYNKTRWVNNETPLNEENLNKIESGIAEAINLANANEASIGSLTVELRGNEINNIINHNKTLDAIDLLKNSINNNAKFLPISLAVTEPIAPEESIKLYDFVYFASSIDKAATSFVAHLYDIEGEQPEPKHEHVACPECGKCTADDCDGAEEEQCAGHEIVTPTQGLKEGQAYRFTLVQPKASKTVYFTGKMSSYYYATSTDINAGVDVFVEYVEGGLNLYFVDANGAKHYMGMAVSGTHINAVFDQDKTVFTYNEELQTVVGLVDGKEYVFGTRNDNTYTTIGANALSYNPFMVTFVPVGGEAPHEHNFVEGKCECGEVDPNYVPTHKHEICPECGKCLLEECDGEKCTGHENQPETETKAELTVNSLGIKDQTYAAGVANVNGVDFEFIQIGNFECFFYV